MTVGSDPVPPRVVPNVGLVESVVAAFYLPRPMHWLDLGGLWTTNLRFDYADGSAVVARAHRGVTTPERLLAIQSAKTAARRSGLPVPAPIPAADGRGWSHLPDGTLVEVEEHIDWDTPMRTFSLLHKGFSALARLHDALRTLHPATPVPSPPHATYLDPDQVADGVCRGASRMRAWREPRFATLADDVQRHCEAIADKEERLRHDQVRQLVHGDFWDNNVVFRGQQLAGVLDFDFMGQRDRIEELALTLWFYLLEPGNNPPGGVQVQQVRELVNAYDQSSTLRLSDAERERLPLALARQPAWIAGGWLPALDDAGARAQAADLAARLPTAEAILADLSTWTAALTP